MTNHNEANIKYTYKHEIRSTFGMTCIAVKYKHEHVLLFV